MQPNLLLDYELAVGRDEYIVRALLRLTGRAPTGKRRIPLNISIVLDRSGSMEGPKLGAARHAAAALVQRLFPEDVVSVVTYDDTVQTVALPGTSADQTGLTAAIRAIESGGCTNLSGGWLRGRELVASRLQPGGVNRVLLMTDGHANAGITEPAQLTGLCREAHEHGVATSTIGFGADYDEHLLRRMADAGGGHTYYIERPDQATDAFRDEIEGLLSLCAQNVDVEIRPTGAAAFTRVLHSFPKEDVPGGVRLSLGDLFAREPKLVLLEFVVPGAQERDELEIAQLRITGYVLTESGGVERQEVLLSIRTSLGRGGHAEPEVRREVLLQEAARAREEALERERAGDHHGAAARLRECGQQLRIELPHDAAALEEARDLDRMAATCAAGAVSEMDRKYMHQRAYDVSRSKMASLAAYARSEPRTRGVQHVHGDATHPLGHGQKLVAHVVDSGGSWGPGFCQALSARWPQVETVFRGWSLGAPVPGNVPFAPGQVLFFPVAPEITVALMVARGGQGTAGPPQIDYAALDAALEALADEAIRTGSSVHMPRVATAAGGARWSQVERLLERRLCRMGVPVTVYRL